MLQWHPQVSPVLSGLLALAAGGWAALQYRRMAGRMPRPRVWLLLVPKLTVIALLLLALFDPVWVTRRRLEQRGRVLVLVDSSGSMQVRDGAAPRAVRARDALERWTRELRPEFTVDARWFDTQIRTQAPPAAVAGELPGTDLGGCLRALADGADLSAYHAVAVLTDGGDERVEVPRLPAVSTYFVGVGSDPATWSDVAIEDVVRPPSAEAGVQFEVQVDLQARARPGSALEGRLRSVRVAIETVTGAAGTVVGEVRADLSRQRARVTFPVTAPGPGTVQYRVVCDPLEGELSTLNNRRTFTLDVQKKAVHVLYFTRELGMDFKMLRGALGRDPGLTFTALFRTLGERFTVQGERQAGDEELEAGFPTSEKTLRLFDCVIVGSFPAREWTEAGLKALRTYVEEGGAAVFLGGEDSFGRGGYADSALAPLFPWQLSAVEPELFRGAVPVAVPPAASVHPVVSGLPALLAESGDSALDSANLPGPLKLGATALLEGRVGDRSVALVAVQPVGKGRALGIASNGLWKWARRPRALATAFERFWRQAIRDVTGGADSGRLLAVHWERDQYRPGEQAVASIRVAGQETAAGAELSAAVTLGNETKAVPVEPGLEEGTHALRVPFPTRGEYRVKVALRKREAELETVEQTFRVGPGVEEGSRLAVDEAFLRELGSRTGGGYLAESEAGRLPALLKAGFAQKSATTETSLTRTGPWFFLLLLAAFVVEWVLRRRFFLV